MRSCGLFSKGDRRDRTHAAGSPAPSAELGSSRDQLQARLEETELRARLAWEAAEILAARFAKIPERHRPYFTPAQRFRILEIRAFPAWSAKEAARVFLVCPNTILNWETDRHHAFGAHRAAWFRALGLSASAADRKPRGTAGLVGLEEPPIGA